MARTQPSIVHLLWRIGSGITCLGLASCGGADESSHDTAAASTVNGCPLEALVDATGQERVEIRFGGEVGYRYEPACLAVSPGTRVDFVGPFDAHPLAVGRIDDQGIPTLEPNSPIQATSEGSRATFDLEHSGVYGYFCDMHVGDAMVGVIVAR
ncbi:hypothetical protein MK489_17280 [Myxococcota bacterium]|nr:hypothetical protein [Myxococcota bacterium]